MTFTGSLPLEAFAKCPFTGCPVMVWGLTATANACRSHGGNQLGFPEVNDDEYGNPRTERADPPPPASGSLSEIA